MHLYNSRILHTLSRYRQSQKEYLDAIFDIAKTEKNEVLVDSMRNYKYVYIMDIARVYITIDFSLFLIQMPSI